MFQARAAAPKLNASQLASILTRAGLQTTILKKHFQGKPATSPAPQAQPLSEFERLKPLQLVPEVEAGGRRLSGESDAAADTRKAVHLRRLQVNIGKS
jgi:hypothetical protein